MKALRRLLPVIPALAACSGPGPVTGMPGWNHWHGFPMAGVLGILVVIGLALTLFFWALGDDPEPPPACPDSPEDVLKRRLANGDITREEYARLLQEIRKD